MKLEIRALRLFTATLVATGFALGVQASPAGAQDVTEKLPWYMPQPWVHPPQTGPKIRKLPGQYGHTYRNRSYGGFSNGCYGDCRDDLPGTISTGNGYILQRPVVAIFDPRAYQVVPRQAYLAEPPTAKAARAPIKPAVVSAMTRNMQQKPKPNVTTQNGVRVIRLQPITY
jgi:hypothetical protein